MTENIIYRLLENIIPLLLTAVILLAAVTILIKKIFNPFSIAGNWMYDRYKRFSATVTQTRQEKINKKYSLLNSKYNSLESEYNKRNARLIETKDKINELSKYFTELNELEMRKNLLTELKKNTEAEISETKENIPKNILKIAAGRIKIRKLKSTAKKTEKNIPGIEEDIHSQKKIIKDIIDELTNSIKQLTD